MELVRTDVVHLAGEDCLVSGATEVVDEGWDRGGQLFRVVVDGEAARELAGHHRRAGRGAEGVVAVGALEGGAAVGEGLEVRRQYVAVAVGRRGEGGKLIRHDEEDVWTLGRGGSGHRGRIVAVW